MKKQITNEKARALFKENGGVLRTNKTRLIGSVLNLDRADIFNRRHL